MSYVPIQLNPNTPPVVEKFIKNAIENLYFSDVHAMLRLPILSKDISAGLNFAILQSLLAVISGMSATLYNSKGEPGNLFKTALSEYYPWDLEPDGAETYMAAAGIIYDVFRNPLTHNVGSYFDRKQETRILVKKNYAVKVKRYRNLEDMTGPEEIWIETLEASRSRPKFEPTLKAAPHKKVLLVEALYWGTRCMIGRLTDDQERMETAEQLLRDYPR